MCSKKWEMPELLLVSYLLPAPTITMTVTDSNEGILTVKSLTPFSKTYFLNSIQDFYFTMKPSLLPARVIMLHKIFTVSYTSFMPLLEPYILLFLLIIVINIIPAFMPPTWIVLTLFTSQFHIPLLPAVLIGVTAATTGRVLLALLARHFSGFFRHQSFFRNYNHLGTYLSSHQHVTIPIVLGYMLTPISSASLFIMAGLSRMRLRAVIIAFLLGRLISYTFWVTASHQVTKQFNVLFEHTNPKLNTILSLIISILIIFIVGKINWKKLLFREKAKRRH